MTGVTQILTAIERGEPRAAEELLPLVYDELRRLAAFKLAQEKPGQTLQATALVHEAWLRLVSSNREESEPQWEGRRHFFGAAAEAMRRILVENARRKKRLRHGGALVRVELDEYDSRLACPMPDDDLLALDEALTRLGSLSACAAEVVNLCFFGGLTQEQAARQMEVSLATVERLWAFARAWLFREIRRELSAPG
jgi:RNA polymerase sigma factor (TIGR02999 family)